MPTVIIQARIDSTRLPRKVMKPLLNKPVLWHVINRVLKASFIDEIIIATTINHGDDIIAKFCEDRDILIFRGSENDVLDRYYQCAKEYDIEDIVRITADCSLHDPNVIDLVLSEYMQGNFDYVSNTVEYTFPDGLDVEVFSFKALETAWKNAELPSEREHVTPYIKKNERFKRKNVYSSKKYPLYRLTLDNSEDYRFIKSVYEGIGRRMFYLDEVIEFLEKNPKLLEINQHIGMNEGYQKSLEDDLEYMGKLKMQDVQIDGKRVYLRKLTEEDASQEYCSWLNDPLVNRFLETKKTTIEELKEYIKEKDERLDCLFLGIFSKDTKEHIGNVKLEPIHFDSKEATLGILIGNKDYWGKGICAEAVHLVIDYAFKNLNLEKINLGVISENKAAINCYINAGFRIDKTERGAIKHDNVLCDKVIMSIENN